MNKVLVVVNIPYAIEIPVADIDMYRADDLAEEQVMNDPRVSSLLATHDVGADDITSEIVQITTEEK